MFMYDLPDIVNHTNPHLFADGSQCETDSDMDCRSMINCAIVIGQQLMDLSLRKR